MTNDNKQPDVLDILFDGYAVYEEVKAAGRERRTSPECVSDTLDAVVRLLRRAAPTPPSAPVQQSVIASYDHMKAAFAKWWKDSGGGPISMETNARHAWMNAWQAALSTSPLLDKNDQADKCPVCNGNDKDAPCAYTTEKPAGCLRVARLWPQTDSNELVELRMALKPFALASIEGVVTKESGYVTITTCAEYFHRAAAALAQSPSVGLNTKKGGE